jgi:hypothetical protein
VLQIVGPDIRRVGGQGQRKVFPNLGHTFILKNYPKYEKQPQWQKFAQL